MRNALAVPWLGLEAFTAEGPGSIPGRGTKIPQTTQYSQEKRKKYYETRSNRKLSNRKTSKSWPQVYSR